MKILHTGDWHLGDRLNHIDRTADIRRAIERVARYCDEHAVDVLLVAGDLFSERCRADHLRDAIEHLNRTWRPFLDRGGTVVALTGNHDNETFCRTLCHAMSLATAGPVPAGVAPAGRFYLATEPALYRLRGPGGETVQFVLMPYPTEPRYLAGEAQKYDSLEDKHRALQDAYVRRLRDLRWHKTFDERLPSVLAAHVHVKGSVLPGRFRVTTGDDILFDPAELANGWAYVALGHIHQPQSLPGLPHVRYCGSVERLDLGESRDLKSVALIDVGPDGLRGPPELLPLSPTPFHDLVIHDPGTDFPRLREQFRDDAAALVRCHVNFRSGTDDLNAALREVRALFPRCYHLTWSDRHAPTPAVGPEPDAARASLRGLVLDYLGTQLADHPEREAVLHLAEGLLVEEGQ